MKTNRFILLTLTSVMVMMGCSKKGSNPESYEPLPTSSSQESSSTSIAPLIKMTEKDVKPQIY